MKLLVIVIGLFFVVCDAADEPISRLRCNRAYRCLPFEEPVWATDGKKCYVFRNNCYFQSENCSRLNRCQPDLEIVPKDKCQALCSPICTKILRPVCGYYNNEKREFSNQCMMNYYICSTGKTYMVFNEGPCTEPLTLTDDS